MKRNHMNTTLLTSALLLAGALTTTQAIADEWDGNINLLLGQKSLDSDDWGDNDSQKAFGIQFDFARSEWPVHLVVDLYGAGETEGNGDDKVEDVTGGLHLGVRKYWTVGSSSFTPFVGGGLALVTAESTTGSGDDKETVEDDEGGLGYWVGGGAKWVLGEHLNIGGEVRYSQAEVDLDGTELEAGGVYAGLLAGYHW